MNAKSSPPLIPIGFAIFSMFFGAGNVVFPLAIGKITQSAFPFAMIALTITAILMPLAGLLAMLLYNGHVPLFFNRPGKITGWFLMLAIISIIGPFGGIPRIITVSYHTLETFFPNLSLPLYNGCASLLILALSWKENRVVEVIGKYLTPLLLLSLFSIFLVGLISPTPEIEPGPSLSYSFSYGFIEGYKTLDLLGAFYFATIILVEFKKYLNPETPEGNRQLLKWGLLTSLIAGVLLFITYFGFGLLTASYSQQLANVSDGKLIGALAKIVLGPFGGLAAALAVALACLTTAIALVAVSAEFIHDELAPKQMSYHVGLVATLLIAFLVSTLEFTGINDMLGPIVKIAYPSLIVLSVMNILNRLYKIEAIKLPFYLTLLISIYFSFR